MSESGSNKLRPIDAFVKYFLDVKPYHTKLLEVVERYKFAESMTVDFAENIFTKVKYHNTPLCKAVGFGLIFDNCGFSNDSCCDLFQCLGGYGLIFDNSELVATHPIESTDTISDEIVIDGDYTYDRRLEVIQINQNNLVLRGDRSADFDTQKLFLIAPFNVYTIIDFTAKSITVLGDVATELNNKKEFRISGSTYMSGMYGVASAVYNAVDGITVVTIAGNRTLSGDITNAYIETESQSKNQGFYSVDTISVGDDGNTTIFIKNVLFPAPSQTDNGSVQLRTALTAPRTIWLYNTTPTETGREYRIADSYYDVATNKTHIILAEQLWVGEVYNEIRLYGYMTGSGFDGNAECDVPKPTNIHTSFGEKLRILIRDIIRPVFGYQQKVMQDNPKYYWTFDEPAVDHSWAVRDIINNLIMYHNSDDYLQDSFTVAGNNGIYLDTLTDQNEIVLPVSTTGYSLELWWMLAEPLEFAAGQYRNLLIASALGLVCRNIAGTRYIQVTNTAGTYDVLGTLSVPCSETTLNHIVITHDKFGNVQLFVNGSLIGTSNIGIEGTASFYSLGGTNVYSYYDEFAIYEHVLTADRVLEHYNAGRATTEIMGSYAPTASTQRISLIDVNPNYLSSDTVLSNAFKLSPDGNRVFKQLKDKTLTTLDHAIEAWTKTGSTFTHTATLTRASLPTDGYFQAANTIACSTDGSRIAAGYSVVGVGRFIGIFNYSAGNWTLTQSMQLSGVSGVVAEGVNAFISMSKDGLKLSATYHDSASNICVDIYKYNGTSYVLSDTIVVPANMVTGPDAAGRMSDNGVVAITIPTGRLLVYEETSTDTWTQTYNFSFGSNIDLPGENANDQNVAISADGNVIAVSVRHTSNPLLTRRGYTGGYYSDDYGVYVQLFKKEGGVWTEHQRIRNEIPQQDTYANVNWTLSAIAISDNYRIIISDFASWHRSRFGGLLYVYEPVETVGADTIWRLVDWKSGTNNQYFTYLGSAIDISSDGTQLVAVSEGEAPLPYINRDHANPPAPGVYDLNNDYWRYDYGPGYIHAFDLPSVYTVDGYDSQVVNTHKMLVDEFGEYIFKNTHHWAFDAAKDSGGVGYTLSSTAQLIEGPMGKAVLFDGSSDAAVTLDTPVTLDDNFALELWVFPQGLTGDYRTLIGNDTGFSLQLMPDSNLLMFYADDTTQYTDSAIGPTFVTGASGFPIKDSEWSHIVVRYDRSRFSDYGTEGGKPNVPLTGAVYAMEVNGVFAGEVILDKPDKAIKYIGNNSDGEAFKGIIHSASIYNYGIANREIKTNYLAGLMSGQITPTPYPSVTPTPSITPSLSVGATPSPTPTMSITPTPTPSVGSSATPTPTPSTTMTMTPSVTASQLPLNYFGTVMEKSPIHYWTFSDEHTSSYNDFVGNNPINKNSTAFNAFDDDSAVEDDAMHPTQGSFYGTISTPIALTSNFSIEVWVYVLPTPSTTINPILTSNTNAADGWFAIYTNELGVVNFSGLDTRPADTYGPNITPEVFSHIVVTCGADLVLRYYVNGVLANTGTATGNTLHLSMVGRDYLGNYFKGTIDELAIYGRELTLSEVQDNYAIGAAKLIMPTPTPTPSNTRTPTPTPSHSRTPTPTPTPSLSFGVTPSPTPAATYDSVVLGDSPHYYWPLTTITSDSTAEDVVAGNIITANESVYTNFDADSVGEHIRIFKPNVPATTGFTMGTGATLTNNFSLEVWFNSATFGSYATLFGDPSSSLYGLQFDGTGVLYWYGSTDSSPLCVAGDVIAGETYHLVMTSDASGNLTTYLNATALAEAAVGVDTYNIQLIGTDGSGEQFYGLIGKPAIYNYPLTAEQVASHYNSGIATFGDLFAPITGTQIESSTADAGTTLTNNNLTASYLSTDANHSVRVSTRKRTGKWYFEVSLDALVSGGYFDIGLINNSTLVISPSYLTQNPYGFMFETGDAYPLSVSVTGNGFNDGAYSAPTVGEVMQIAVDLDTGSAWYKFDSLSAWAGGGDPAAGTFPTVTFNVTEAMVPAFGVVGAQLTLNFGASAFSGTSPTGFDPWDTTPVV